MKPSSLVLPFIIFSHSFYAQAQHERPAQTTVTCNNWVSTPTAISAINIGNLGITGNQLTVEATIYPTAFNPLAGDIVSKHSSPSDCNYLLRMEAGYITTTSGFFGATNSCATVLNKIYHLAMVYDGSTLKYYHNGFLTGATAANGNLTQNSLNTLIGYYAFLTQNTQFFGYINEVRIWNVARTQAELRAYINTSLPNPATQTGLLAYYTFDNLLNKQGNATYNGVIVGNASINQTVPDCAFVVDSCGILVLPVTITKFESNISNKQIKLNWNVQNEELILKYTVERSITGHSDFVAIGTVIANGVSSYFYVDNATDVNQTYYYRLAILDKSYQINYSQVKMARRQSDNKILVVYPNPSNGNIAVRINGYKGKAMFTIRNSVGQTVLDETKMITDNSPLIFKLINQSKGIYWLKVETANEQCIEKLMLH